MQASTSTLLVGVAPILLTASLLASAAAAQNTTRLSVNAQGEQGNGQSNNTSISADGQVVAFESMADNLVPGDTNATSDVFVFDRGTGTIIRASIDSQGNQGNGYSFFASLSADGKSVAFTSLATNLVPGDTNGTFDVFVHDLQTGETTRVSVDAQGNQANKESAYASISADGRFAAFQSMATNLVAGDTNDRIDVFVHDLYSLETTRVSVDSQGNQANNESDFAVISADGLVVGFYSYATNLVPGDTNGHIDTFVHDRQTGTTTRVSVDPQGNQFNGDSYYPSLSGDGRFAAFPSPSGIFVYDRQTGATTPVAFGTRPSISTDGDYVAFLSADKLVPEDTNGLADIYLADQHTGAIERISVDSSGAQGNGAANGGLYCYVSDGGQFVAFSSLASNLVSGDTNHALDVFLRKVVCDPPGSGVCLAPPSGLVAWWPLDVDGPWVNDLRIQNGGWLRNAVADAGVVDGALSFDGSLDSVQVPQPLCPPPLDFGTGDFSIVAWIKTTDAINARPIVSKRSPLTFGYSLGTEGGVLSFTLADGSAVTIRGSRPVADGCWHAVAATIDRDDPSGARLYIDGMLDVAASVASHPFSTSNVTPLLIGALAGTAVSFLGSIDEVQLFARSLSGAEVAAIFQAGASGQCKPPCVSAPAVVAAWWPFDEPGTLATDLAGCRNGTLIGTPLPAHVPGVASGALSFNRSNWVVVPDSNCLDVGTSDFSIEAWIRPTGSPFGALSILDKRDLAKGYHWFLFDGNLGLQLAFAGTYVNWIAPVTVKFDCWHHVAVTVKRTVSNGGHLYVDGQDVKTFDPTPMNVDVSNASNLLLGGHRDLPVYRFSGSIDEVTLYHSVLSASDVRAVFLAGAGAKCK